MRGGETEAEEPGVDADRRDDESDRPGNPATAGRARRLGGHAAGHRNPYEPAGRVARRGRTAGLGSKRPASETKRCCRDAAGNRRDAGSLGEPAPRSRPAVFRGRLAGAGLRSTGRPHNGLAWTWRAGRFCHRIAVGLRPPAACVPAGRVAFRTPATLSSKPAAARASHGSSEPGSPGRGAVPP
jgi:hypothetical protein